MIVASAGADALIPVPARQLQRSVAHVLAHNLRPCQHDGSQRGLSGTKRLAPTIYTLLPTTGTFARNLVLLKCSLCIIEYPGKTVLLYELPNVLCL